jgi:phosphate transport system substrate-binding protein
MEACKHAQVEYFELPIAYDALTVVIHPENKWAETMTIADLKKIWEPESQGKITRWNQVRSEWPNVEIKLYGAGADSGTFDYFTEAVNGKSKKSRGDYTASEDDNTLVQGISRDKNALGYLPYSYYEANKKKLKAVAIDGGAKSPKKGAVFPSRESVEGGAYFPLSRPIFIYVSAKGLTKKEVREFTEFYIQEGGKLAAEVKYIPLPKKAYALAAEILKKGRKGTVFGGHSEIGLKIEELLKRETRL